MPRTISNAVLANKIDNLTETMKEVKAFMEKMDERYQAQAVDIGQVATDLATTKIDFVNRIDGLDKRVFGWDIANSIAGLVLGAFVVFFKKS